jgi:hypothetical protein
MAVALLAEGGGGNSKGLTHAASVASPLTTDHCHALLQQKLIQDRCHRRLLILLVPTRGHPLSAAVCQVYMLAAQLPGRTSPFMTAVGTASCPTDACFRFIIIIYTLELHTGILNMGAAPSRCIFLENLMPSDMRSSSESCIVSRTCVHQRSVAELCHASEPFLGQAGSSLQAVQLRGKLLNGIQTAPRHMDI